MELLELAFRGIMALVAGFLFVIAAIFQIAMIPGLLIMPFAPILLVFYIIEGHMKKG